MYGAFPAGVIRVIKFLLAPSNYLLIIKFYHIRGILRQGYTLYMIRRSCGKRNSSMS
jgi:hypothetical protein